MLKIDNSISGYISVWDYKKTYKFYLVKDMEEIVAWILLEVGDE